MPPSGRRDAGLRGANKLNEMSKVLSEDARHRVFKRMSMKRSWSRALYRVKAPLVRRGIHRLLITVKENLKNDKIA